MIRFLELEGFRFLILVLYDNLVELFNFFVYFVCEMGTIVFILKGCYEGYVL